MVISRGKLRVSNAIRRITNVRPLSGGFRDFNFRMVGVSNRSFGRVRSTLRGTGAMGNGPATVLTGAVGNGNISFVRGRIN